MDGVITGLDGLATTGLNSRLRRFRYRPALRTGPVWIPVLAASSAGVPAQRQTPGCQRGGVNRISKNAWSPYY